MERSAYIETGAGRYREDKGLYLEELEPGLAIEHRPGRTVTMTDNTWLALLTMNQHPLHIDAEYAASTEFGRILVCGMLTFSIVNGMSVSSISQKTIASLGWDNVRFTAPVFVGDTLYADTLVLSRRNSTSRPHQGVVTVRTRGVNQSGRTVVTFERTMLMPSRDYVRRESIELAAGQPVDNEPASACRGDV